MAAVVGRDAAAPLPEPRSKSTHSNQATQLLDMLTAAKPTISNGFAPGVGMPGGGDIRKPQGLYTYALIGPGVWPSESESQLNDTANQLSKLADEHEDASNTAKAQSDEVFSAYWTSGDGAAAAEEHYHKEHTLHENLIDAMRFVSRGYGRLSENFRSIKGKMRKAHDDAHDEIEQTLRANRGQPVGVGPIVSKPESVDGRSAMIGV